MKKNKLIEPRCGLVGGCLGHDEKKTFLAGPRRGLVGGCLGHG